MSTDWHIRSIKKQAGGTWDALLIAEVGGNKTYQRVFSDDGFHWSDRHWVETTSKMQIELTESVGDMEAMGIRFVVF